MTTILLAAVLSAVAQSEEDYYPIVPLPIPPGVVLEGGGIELMPDGKLAVSSRRGDIYMVENAFLNPPDPGKVTFTLWAQGKITFNEMMRRSQEPDSLQKKVREHTEERQRQQKKGETS